MLSRSVAVVDKAFAKISGERLDNHCVTALMAHQEEIAAMQKRCTKDA